MKKVLAILCLICLCFIFTACNQQSTQADVTTEVEEIEQEVETQTEQTTEILIDETDEEQEETQSESSSQDSSTITTTTETTAVATTTVSSSTTATTISSTTKADNSTSTTTTKAADTTTTAATTTTTKATTTTTTQAQNYCYVTIDMTNALKNISDFTSAKASFVPSSGILLSKTKVYYNDGETLFDAILRACSENVCSDNCKYCQSSAIQIEYQYTPAYNSYYIEGVHQIYEMDCGVMSGWMVYVNGQSIQSSSSTIEIQNGDSIVLAYTCSMGSDINF